MKSFRLILECSDSTMYRAGMLMVLVIMFVFTASAVFAGEVPATVPVGIAPIEAPFEMPQLQRPVFADRTFNIVDYGAKGDGTTKNTEAFRKAIEACNAAGGGKVLVPVGKWLTGAIHLKSNVNLHIEEGAEVHFSDDPEDYLPPVFVRYAGKECMNYSPLIYARDCVNIALTGSGTINGHGLKWWQNWTKRGKTHLELQAYGRLDEMSAANVPVKKRIIPTDKKAGLRPTIIDFVNCRNVLIEGITVLDSPFWNIHPTYCENVIIREVTVVNDGPNGDGINPDSCRNVLIENCLTDTGDDCVTLKSGMNEDGWRIGRPCENIVIRNCSAKAGHGGIVIGSEMSGGVRNVLAYDCVFDGSDCGIRLKSNPQRGGVVENIYYRNITMRNIKTEAIRINTNYWGVENGTHYPIFRNITFKDIVCDGVKSAASVNGKSEKPIENLTLENVSIKANSGMSFNWVDGLKLINVTSTPKSGNPISFKNCKDVVQSSAAPVEAKSADLNRWYAVVVSEGTGNDLDWKKVVDALVTKYNAAVLTYKKEVAEILDPLRQQFPEYVCFVATPEEATLKQIETFHQLTRKLDADLYTDVIWGVLTGYNAADALRIAAHSEPLVVKRCLTGTVGSPLDSYEQGRMYNELEKGICWEKKDREGIEKQTCPTDTTKMLVDDLNLYKPDVFITSGHASDRNWVIGYGYHNGTFECNDGQLFGKDIEGKIYDINSPNPKIHMAVGNCQIANIPDRNCMALALMHSAGVYQMLGYTIPTGYGYGGWGVKDYFSELQAGRFTLAEAHYVNNLALVYEIEKQGVKGNVPGGLQGDRDVVVLYGDPAWQVKMPKRPLPWTQTLSEQGGVYRFTITANETGDWDNRPIVHLLPYRIKDIQLLEGDSLNPVITDNFILVQMRDELLPMKGNCGEEIPIRGDYEKGQTFEIVFRAKKIQ